MVGGSRTGCGRGWCRFCRSRRRTRWVVTGRASRERPKPTRKRPQGLCLDRGYDYNEVRDLCAEFTFTTHIRGRDEEAQAIKREAGFRARRWVVERTHSWLNRFRRILTRWEVLRPIRPTGSLV